MFVDDITVSTGEGSTSFETGLEGWSVPGSAPGSGPNANDYIVTTAAGFPEGAAREKADLAALIHDDVMRGWLATVDRPDLAVSRYDGNVSESYLVQMKAWAEGLGTDPETVEWVIFRDEQRKKPPQPMEQR